MSIQNGQPLIEATRNETSGTSPFDNWPDFAIDAPSALTARSIGGGGMRHDFCRIQQIAKDFALPGELLLQDRIAAVILDFAYPGHSVPSL
jgi:hypothetical protein